MIIGLDESFYASFSAGDAIIFQHNDEHSTADEHYHHARLMAHLDRIFTLLQTVKTREEACNIITTAQAQMGCYCFHCTIVWNYWESEFWDILNNRVF